MHFVRRYYRLILLGLLTLALMVPIVMRITISPFIAESMKTVPSTDAALILGASVFRGSPSPILAERADAAIALYRAGKVSKILVTGDNGAPSHNEVIPVRDYLLKAGIPARDIFLDHAGFDTYSSMYRARYVFLARSVTVVTQDFHLPRALWIARHLGLYAFGMVAEGGENSPAGYVREIPASMKAIFDVLTQREPKYLGPVFPLAGNGEATWY